MARKATAKAAPEPVPAAKPAGAAKAAKPAPTRPKGARRTTPSPETLAELGAERLIALVLDETARNPAFKKLVSAALAGLQGADAVAAMVDRRLAALEGARGYVDWQKRRAFAADLNATVTVILKELAALDPAAALDRLVRFLAGSGGVLQRVDDTSGSIAGLYERAATEAGALVERLPDAERERIALRLVEPFAADPFGPLADLLHAIVERLPAEGCMAFDAALAEAADRPGRGRADGHDYRRVSLLRLRQHLADRRGDPEGYIALEQEAAPQRPDTAAIAERLLAAGRPAEALDWLHRPAGKGLRVVTRAELIAGRGAPLAASDGRTSLEIRILEALGRPEAAQARRWARFEAVLDAEMLRAYLAKLPDFEDDDALERALDHAEAAEPVPALRFLVNWPRLDRAARLVRARRGPWPGDRYDVLAPAAEALEADHPEAAVLLYRSLIDDILAHGRSQAYPHAARYLARLEGLDPGDLKPDTARYRATLRTGHGRKHGFWALVKD